MAKKATWVILNDVCCASIGFLKAYSLRNVFFTIVFLAMLTLFPVSSWHSRVFAEEWESVVDSGDFARDSSDTGSASHAKKASEESEWEEVFVNNWEALDSYLVNTISSLPKDALSGDERNVLLESLLESRYKFVAKLSDPDKTSEKGFIEEEFIGAWEDIAPIMKKHISDQSSENGKKQLAFIAASDAIMEQDKASPGKRDKITKKDLTRLAKTMNNDDSFALEYNYDVNEKLRDVLGLDPEPDEWNVGSDVGDDDHSAKSDSLVNAGGKKKWIVTKDNFDSYLERIKCLLKESSDNALKKRKLDKKYHSLYRTFVLSTAWQESCYRHFTKKGKKIDYLRSYDDSSVGLMQINERVWRGLYDQDRIRWDIRYNAMVGCEIANLYLGKYALGKMKKMKLEKPIDDVTLSRALYAMYNGGPGQFHKFLKRNKTGKYWKIDRYFYQKYKWVRADQWSKLCKCLFGK